MPRLPPLASKYVVRKTISIVAPSKVAVAARRSALAELSQMREEGDRAREEDSLPVVDSLQWSSPLQVLQYPHPQLRAVNARLSPAAFGPELRKLADEMFDIMYRDHGVGLAAPQVGVNVRVMVFNPDGQRGEGEELIMANPRIISKGRQMDVQQEGCLSFKKLGGSTEDLIFGDVERSLRVKVSAQDEGGRSYTRTFTGWTARIFQHEFDHLEGTLFPDRARRSWATMLPELHRLEEDYLSRHPSANFKRYEE